MLDLLELWTALDVQATVRRKQQSKQQSSVYALHQVSSASVLNPPFLATASA